MSRIYFLPILCCIHVWLLLYFGVCIYIHCVCRVIKWWDYNTFVYCVHTVVAATSNTTPGRRRMSYGKYVSNYYACCAVLSWYNKPAYQWYVGKYVPGALLTWWIPSTYVHICIEFPLAVNDSIEAVLGQPINPLDQIGYFSPGHVGH